MKAATETSSHPLQTKAMTIDLPGMNAPCPRESRNRDPSLAETQPGMGAAVGEIDHQPDHQPGSQPHPGVDAQPQQQPEASEDAENRQKRHVRHAERSRLVRLGAAQIDDSNADQD